MHLYNPLEPPIPTDPAERNQRLALILDHKFAGHRNDLSWVEVNDKQSSARIESTNLKTGKPASTFVEAPSEILKTLNLKAGQLIQSSVRHVDDPMGWVGSATAGLNNHQPLAPGHLPINWDRRHATMAENLAKTMRDHEARMRPYAAGARRHRPAQESAPGKGKGKEREQSDMPERAEMDGPPALNTRGARRASGLQEPPAPPAAGPSGTTGSRRPPSPRMPAELSPPEQPAAGPSAAAGKRRRDVPQEEPDLFAPDPPPAPKRPRTARTSYPARPIGTGSVVRGNERHFARADHSRREPPPPRPLFAGPANFLAHNDKVNARAAGK